MIHVPDGWEAGFDAAAGMIDIELALRAMMECALGGGMELRPKARVKAWAASPDSVRVETEDRRYDAGALIVTAGAWSAPLLRELNLPLSIQRKVQFWFKVKAPALYAPDRFPIFITDSDYGEIYGLPIYATPGIKMGNHAGGDPTDPDHVNRTVTDVEINDVVRFTSWFFDGVTPNVLETSVCLYARTPDGNFILDRHPQLPNVVFGAGFSGHGFKFAPAIGEHLVSLALDAGTQASPLFSLKRFW
jgi:sarcosine oxidase